jgi:hypothetical protein
MPKPLAKRSGTYLVDDVRDPHLILFRPEAELLTPASGLQPLATKRQETASPSGDHTHAAKIPEAPQHRRAALSHEATGREGSDSRHSDQLFIGCGTHFHREALRVVQCPRRFRIV